MIIDTNINATLFPQPIQYFMHDILNPFVKRKNGFHSPIIMNVLTAFPKITPNNPQK